MGFQFTNNWPYSNTVFPSMTDHVDPVNQEYFDGLHQEIDTLESYLGIHPQGAEADVAARLLAEEARLTALESAGGSSPLSDIWIPAKSAQLGADPAVLGTQGPSSWTIGTLTYVHTGNTFAYFECVIPYGGDSANIDIDIYYSGGGSNFHIAWALKAASYAPGEDLGYPDAVFNPGVVLADSANWNLKVQTQNWQLANLKAGSYLNIEVGRKPGDVGDDYDASAYVIGVRVREHI